LGAAQSLHSLPTSFYTGFRNIKEARVAKKKRTKNKLHSKRLSKKKKMIKAKKK
jgi:hypothetical protein